MNTQDELASKIQDHKFISIIGVGSQIRGDDTVGLYIAEQLKKELKNPKVEILIGGTTPENLTGVLRRSKPSHILIIDAADDKRKPGEIFLVSPDQIEGMNFSTHSFSLKAFADFMKHEIGAQTIILGIQPLDTSMSELLTHEITHAAEKVIEIVKVLLF